MDTQNRTDGRPQPVAIGIDLGTSKCCVAAVRDGRAHVLENEFGQRTTPSWVAFNSQQRLVGGAALDQAVVNCANTVSGVKRTLGRTYDDVKGLPSSCEVTKNYHDNSVQFRVNYKKYNKHLRPEQITAMMLTKMKDIAETSLGCEVNRAVISVPASYGNAQRVALKTAAKVAGIEVLQLINETTAAGIAFEDNRTVTTPVTIAVVDFGAGKLDVSVMEVKEKSVKVIAAAGNPNLGGCNIDDFLTDHCAAVIKKDCKITLTADEKAMVRLRLACEKVKKTLSLLPEARLVIDSLIGDTNVDMRVYRKDLNVLIKSEIHKEIFEIFNRILRENNIGKDSIDKVVLVGGSTRIPVVKSILEEYFGPHKLDQTVNQDEAVAQGAALRAAALFGAAAGIEVADVASFDVFSWFNYSSNEIVIRSNSRIPFSNDLQLFSSWKYYVEFYEKSKSKEHRKDALIGSLDFYGIPRKIHVEMNTDGICKFSAPHYYTLSVRRRMYPYYPAHVVSYWTREENQFRRDIEDELKRVEAEVELESLIFQVQSALQDPEIVKYFPRDVNSLQRKCSTAQSCVDDISSYSEYKIEAEIKTMSEAKTEIEQLKAAAHKKAADEKAAKELAELELAVTQKNSELRLLHSELLKSLKQPELVQYSPPEEIKWCKEALGRIDTSQKFASLKEVSEKIELLNSVKSRIEKLKDSYRRKALEEQEAARVKKQHLKKEISSGLLRVKSLRGKLLSSDQGEVQDSQLTDSFQQKIKSFEESLNGIHRWVSNTDTTSMNEISKKIEEVNEIKADVEFENTLRSARIRTSELNEKSTEESNNVSEMSSLENGQTDQINQSDECALHLQSRDMQAQSTNSSVGHTSRSREKHRRNSSSRSRSTERKEKVDCSRSRSPLAKEIEMEHHTQTFGSLSDTERNQVSTVLSQGTKVESNHADGGCRPSEETPVDTSNLSPSYGKEKEHQLPTCLVPVRMVLDHADGECRPSEETTADTSKRKSSCVKENEHHPPASRVTSETEGKCCAAFRSSSASESLPNGANYGSETTSVPVSGQSLLASIPGMKNCVDSDSNNSTALELQRSSPEKVSSLRNDEVNNSTPAILGSPSDAGERESKTAPAEFERKASESSNGANDHQENVAKTSNLFYQYPDVQSRIKREIGTCNGCRISGRVCLKTRSWLIMLLNEMIDDTGTQIFESAASGRNSEALQQITPKVQISVLDVLEQVKKLSYRDTQRH